MASKDNMKNSFEVRNDADLQAIQTSVAFKNISDAIEQYRRQFGLAFLALIAFSAIHVGLVVIANLYTMETRVSGGVLSSTSDPESKPVGVSAAFKTYDLGFIMSNMDEVSQLDALNNLKSTNFVDNDGSYRQYTVTGFQLGGWKRSELKLYTSVGHILEYVRGKGLKVHHDHESLCNCSAGRKLLAAPPSPPPALTTASPPPPWSPGHTMDTFGLDDDVNLTAMLEASTASQDALAATIAASENANNVYSQDWVKTLSEAAGISGASATVTTASKATVLGDKAGNTSPLKSYKQSEYDKEKNAFKDLSLANQATLVDTAMNIGTGAALQVAARLNGSDTSDFDVHSWITSEYGISGDTVTAAQSNESAAVFATNSLVAAQKSHAALQGSQFWEDMKASQDASEAATAKSQTTFEYCCLTADAACAATTCDSNNAIKSYWSAIKTKEGPNIAAATNFNATAHAAEAAANATSWYSSQLAAHGGASGLRNHIRNGVAAQIADAVTNVQAVFSSYKQNGYIQWASATNVQNNVVSATGYGCSNSSISDLQTDFDGPLVSVASVCLSTVSSGAHAGEYSDPYSAGSFFSAALGYHESYSMYTPPSVCHSIESISSGSNPSSIGAYRSALSDTTVAFGDGVETEFVYMLHGWGGSDSFLHLMSVTLKYVFDVRSNGHHYGAVDGFIVMAPADGSTPYAHKTWYFNNEFTGFHMDMIVFELKSFIISSIGVQHRAQGCFGFSMGGWGAMHIAMTYPDQFQAIASFNSPMKPNSCHYANLCHVECGVDFFMCELMWTTIGVAANPYVVVVADQSMASSGPYSPVATGNLANVMDNDLIYGGFLASAADKAEHGTVGEDFYGQNIRCVTGGGYVAPASLATVTIELSLEDDSDFCKVDKGSCDSDASAVGVGMPSMTVTAASIAHFSSVGYSMASATWNTGKLSGVCDYIEGTEFDNANSCPMTSVLTWVYYAVAWASEIGDNQYFYLDPVTYTRTSQFFSPTHNTLTAAPQRGTNRNGAFYNLLNVMPYNRLINHDGAFSHYPLWFLVSCDSNDQNGASPDNDSYIGELYSFERDTQHIHPAFGWVYDKFDTKGHSYSQRDMRLSIQWMSDAFRTFTGLGDLAPSTTSEVTSEWADNKKDFNEFFTSTSNSDSPLGGCYLEQEWKTFMGAYSIGEQEFVQSGGYFDHNTACDSTVWGSQGTTSVTISSMRHLLSAVDFYHPGPPEGVYADQIDAQEYAIASHELMESGPSAGAMKDLNDQIKASGAYGGSKDFDFGQITCWGMVEPGDTFTSGGSSVTTNVANCCNGGQYTTDCTSHMKNNYAVRMTDCCPKANYGNLGLSTAQASYYTALKGEESDDVFDSYPEKDDSDLPEYYS